MSMPSIIGVPPWIGFLNGWRCRLGISRFIRLRRFERRRRVAPGDWLEPEELAGALERDLARTAALFARCDAGDDAERNDALPFAHGAIGSDERRAARAASWLGPSSSSGTRCTLMLKPR